MCENRQGGKEKKRRKRKREAVRIPEEMAGK